MKFDVSYLDGHSDLVCAVVMDTVHLVTAGYVQSSSLVELAQLLNCISE